MFLKDYYKENFGINDDLKIEKLGPPGQIIKENEEWDFTAVYFDSIDHFSHIFMKYNPPKMNEEIDEKLYDRNKVCKNIRTIQR